MAGGHADNEQDLLQVAVREVKEESRLARVRPVSEDIYSLEVLTVDGHEKRGGLCGFPPAFECHLSSGGRRERCPVFKGR